MGCNSTHRQTILVWKGGLKELGQRSLDEVLDKIRMEGRENEE